MWGLVKGVWKVAIGIITLFIFAVMLSFFGMCSTVPPTGAPKVQVAAQSTSTPKDVEELEILEKSRGIDSRTAAEQAAKEVGGYGAKAFELRIKRAQQAVPVVQHVEPRQATDPNIWTPQDIKELEALEKTCGINSQQAAKRAAKKVGYGAQAFELRSEWAEKAFTKKVDADIEKKTGVKKGTLEENRKAGRRHEQAKKDFKASVKQFDKLVEEARQEAKEGR